MHPEIVRFFQTPAASKLSEKAQACATNIGGWPNHIARAPLYRLASALIDEKIPVRERGFRPFSIRTIILESTNSQKFGGIGVSVMIMPKFGETVQPAVDAEHIRLNKHGKNVIQWDESTREATDDEVEKFMLAAFPEEK